MDTIASGQALVGNDRIVSRNGKFALGFFQTGSKSSHNTLNWYLRIWYNKVPKLTPVCAANGDNPVIDPTTSELTISGRGENRPDTGGYCFSRNLTHIFLLDSEPDMDMNLGYSGYGYRTDMCQISVRSG